MTYNLFEVVYLFEKMMEYVKNSRQRSVDTATAETGDNPPPPNGHNHRLPPQVVGGAPDCQQTVNDCQGERGSP